jgi:hypothetical protein
MPKYSSRLKPKPKRSRLPIWLALAAGLGLLLLGGWSIWNNNNAQTQANQANIQVKGAPRLKVEQDVIDHGDLKLGNQVRDDVRVTNIGDQPLRFTQAPIVEVKEGC